MTDKATGDVAERERLRQENTALRKALSGIVDAYGSDPEAVRIPASLIEDAERALTPR